MERLDSSAADVVIVSAFGRGNWIAMELAGRGWKTTLVDVSETLGTYAPEDIEGPFGFLEASDLTPSQKSRLEDEGELVFVPAGMTIWLKEGPIECRGDLNRLQLEKRGVSVAVDHYLRRLGPSDRDSERERRALAKKSFRETWFAHFAHQIASPVVRENHEAIGLGAHWPIFAPFSIRQVTAAGLQKGLKNCQSQGVNVKAKAKVREITFNAGSVESIDIQSEGAGVLRTRSLVWMLSSLEARNCPPSVTTELFPRGAIEAEWYWARLQFQLEGDLLEDQLPVHAIVVEDPYLPWSHTNAFVFRKRREPKAIDVWLKLPAHFQSQAGRLAALTKEVQAILERRLPGCKATLQTSTDPSMVSRVLRNPIFNEETLEHLYLRRASNLFYCGPEQWEFSDWLGQYRPQNQLLDRLVKMKAQWDASDAKAAARAAARELKSQRNEEKSP